jgi:putative phosphoesterase
MKKIGLLSDTHSFIDQKILDFFDQCDEIWHAGDIGNIETANVFEGFKPCRAVYGNIDGHDLRLRYPLHQLFKCEEAKIWITHIGGYPGHYDSAVRKMMIENPPDLFICGHSHILKVIPDKKLKLLHINPGAAGKNGFHLVRTAVRFHVDKKNFSELEILEIPRH